MVLRPCRADKRLVELVRGCELLSVRAALDKDTRKFYMSPFRRPVQWSCQHLFWAVRSAPCLMRMGAISTCPLSNARCN